MKSPTQLTLAHCRKIGGLAFVVEHWNAHARIRQDLIGCFDVLWLNVKDQTKTGTIVGIQTTSYSNCSAREKKLRASVACETWRQAGGKVEIHCWKSNTEMRMITL